MLTADLALSWQRGEQIKPRYVDADDGEYLRAAEDLIALFVEHDGARRSTLEESWREYVGTGTDYKILRGLIKLLTDRCEFETSSTVEPVEIRRALFMRARLHHPVIDEETRARVFAEVKNELASDADALDAAVYADLPENQTLDGFETIKPEELLDLYNV